MRSLTWSWWDGDMGHLHPVRQTDHEGIPLCLSAPLLLGGVQGAKLAAPRPLAARPPALTPGKVKSMRTRRQLIRWCKWNNSDAPIRQWHQRCRIDNHLQSRSSGHWGFSRQGSAQQQQQHQAGASQLSQKAMSQKSVLTHAIVAVR